MTDTPVTKLDSLERLVEEYATQIGGLISGDMSNGKSIDAILLAAFTEMWDLSRREALREAAGIVWKWHSSDPMAAFKAEHIVADLERLAVDEGTK
jgi:hypothetical protein